MHFCFNEGLYVYLVMCDPLVLRMDSAFYMGPDQANMVSEFLHLYQHLFAICGIIMNYNTNYYLMKLSKHLKFRCNIGMDILKLLFISQHIKYSCMKRHGIWSMFQKQHKKGK